MLVFASPVAARPVPAPNVPKAPCLIRFTAESTQGFTDRVWKLSAWERGQPPERVLQIYRKRLRCAVGPRNRYAIRHRWRKDKRAFEAHRSRKLAEQSYLDAITPPGPATLAAIRACESGGDYSTNTGNGFWGAYQFTLSTWASVGGSGLPSEASPREQDERAAALYRRDGSSPWPVCGV